MIVELIIAGIVILILCVNKFTEIYKKYSTYNKLIYTTEQLHWQIDVICEIQQLFTVMQYVYNGTIQEYTIRLKIDEYFCFHINIVYAHKKDNKRILRDIEDITRWFNNVIRDYKSFYKEIAYYQYDCKNIFQLYIEIYKDIIKTKMYDEIDNFRFKEEYPFLFYHYSFIKNLNKIYVLKKKNKEETKIGEFINKFSLIPLLKNKIQILSYQVECPGYYCEYIKHSSVFYSSREYLDDIKLIEEYRYKYNDRIKHLNLKRQHKWIKNNIEEYKKFIGKIK